MEIAKRFVILLTLFSLALSAAQSQEKPAPRTSNTRTASCLVKITSDPAVLPLSFESIAYLLASSGVGGKAVREVLDLSPDQVQDLFTIEYVHELTSKAVPKSSSGRSSGRDGEMDEFEYAMMMEAEMEKEMGSFMPAPSTRPLRGRGSSGQTRRNPSTGRTITATSATPETEQTLLFRLNVHLPEDIKPLAKEFMKVLVDSLRESLHEAHQAYSNDLRALLQDAESRRDYARSRLAEAMKLVKAAGPPAEIKLSPADANVYERLEQIVDLPNLTQATMFAEVIRQIANAVQPPLQIQPNWKDLLELGEVEPTTPSGMDPLIGVKLRKALDVLLAGVSSDIYPLNYVVDEGVIRIATQKTLPDKVVPRVYEIPALAYLPGGAEELVKAIQNTIDPESWSEGRELGKGTITPYPRQLPRKLAILQTYENHQRIGEFLQNITIDIPAGPPLDIPEEMLLDEKSNLFREKQNLERELARLQARMPAIEEQIKRIRKEIDEKIQTDQISEELRKIVQLQIKYLEEVKGGRFLDVPVADAEEKVARANIELARRREQIGLSAGTDRLAKLSNELATLAIDMAEKSAMLEVAKKQLDQAEGQLAVADMSDPRVSRLRLATQALEIAERRVNEANAMLVNLQLPTVSVLGAN